MTQQTRRLKRRQSLGQYRIDRHLASSGFASVYAATDTISRLDHPNIVGIKTARMVEERFVAEGYRREFIDFLRRAIEVDERRHFTSCVPVHREFLRLKRRALLAAKPR